MLPVRWALLVAAILLLLTACGTLPFGLPKVAEPQQVAGCEQVGTLSETLDTGKIITALARREMVGRLESRATALGGTHIVWVYRTDEAVGARVFRCEE